MHINQSQLKTWRRCEQQWDYRYGQHLIPRRASRPIRIGLWVHACLETHYRDGDWTKGHEVWVADYNKLFDEEKEDLDKGDEPLPSQIERIMAGYLHRYPRDEWKILKVESKGTRNVRTTTGKIIPLAWRLDILVEDGEGLVWVVDNKTTETIPAETEFQSMDPQLTLYAWGEEKNEGREIAGVIYNYIRSKAPTVPHLNQNGTISKAPVATDYLTMLRFLEENGRDPSDFSELLDGLSRSTDFLRRYRLPRNKVVTDRIVRESIRTARIIMEHSDTTRNVTRDCNGCSYRALCRAELFGLDTSFMRKADFRIEVEEEMEAAYGDQSGQ